MSKTVEALTKAGISARDYARPVLGGAFLISVDRRAKVGPAGQILINEGNAKVKCYVDPKLRQAVLHVNERERSVTRRVTYTTSISPKPTPMRIREELQSRFPVSLQGKINWFYNDVKCEKIMEQYNDYSSISSGFVKRSRFSHWKISGEVTGQVVSHDKHDFLLGMDETANFIAALPQPVKSVAEAHELLKPPANATISEVRKTGIVRQGEWFFKPVSARLEKTLNEYAQQNPGRVRSKRLEVGSTHVAKQALEFRRTIYKPKISTGVYVCGYVMDRRKGHHEPLFLDRWHRVERNREKTFSSSQLRDSKLGIVRRFRSFD